MQMRDGQKGHGEPTPHSTTRRWRDYREPLYEGWNSGIAANQVAANAQTEISTHWSRVIRGLIEKGPANHAKQAARRWRSPGCATLGGFLQARVVVFTSTLALMALEYGQIP
jgi:hypothetical protein